MDYMSELILKTGDIFTTYAQAIGHGVNIKGVMGHGIAVQFKSRFPEMYERYKALCGSEELQPGMAMVWDLPAPQGSGWDRQYVYNIASQDLPGRNARLDWLVSGIRAGLVHAEQHGVRSLALPRIGSGIGGLDQDEVEQAIRAIAESGPVNIEIWTLPAH